MTQDNLSRRRLSLTRRSLGLLRAVICAFALVVLGQAGSPASAAAQPPPPAPNGVCGSAWLQPVAGPLAGLASLLSGDAAADTPTFGSPVFHQATDLRNVELGSRVELPSDPKRVPGPSVSDDARSAPDSGLTGRHGSARSSQTDSANRQAPGLGFVIPNDPFFHEFQRNMQRIQAPDTWGVTFGDTEVPIAILSTGVHASHEDLRGKLWRNHDEVPGNGVDDDGNGYVDDVRGWNFPDDSPDVSDWPLEQGGGFGTMAAGIAAAQTHNNRGVAGVSWHSPIMPLKVIAPWVNDEGDVEPRAWPNDVTRAICYAGANGAEVILIEGWFLLSPTSEDLLRMNQAIQFVGERYGAMVVAPAGECGMPDTCREEANPPIFPANLPDVIGVQSINNNNRTQPWASTGAWVDIVAPGEVLITTRPPDPGAAESPDGQYEDVGGNVFGGSLLAAAHVAGGAAMLRAVNPNLTPYQVRCELCQSAERRFGGPYGQPSLEGEACGFRNDAFGCGLLDLQEAVMDSPWVVRVSASQTHFLTEPDDEETTLCTRLTNRTLNRGAWGVEAIDARWAVPSEVTQPLLGEASKVDVCVDREAIGEASGGRVQAGTRVSATLELCPLHLVTGDCSEVQIWVRFAESLVTLLLPQLLSQ